MSWWLGIGCLAVFHIGLLGYQALKFNRKQHHEQITSRRFSRHFALILLMYIKISISEVTLKHLRAIAVVCWTHADVSIGRIGSPRPENRKVTQMLAHCTQLSQPGPFAIWLITCSTIGKLEKNSLWKLLAGTERAY